MLDIYYRTGRGKVTAAGNTLNCSDFATRSEASRFTRTVDVGDVNRLDADCDGVSCETLPR